MKHPWRYDAIAKRIAYPLTAVCKYFIKVKGQAQSQNNIRKEMSCLRPERARPKKRLIAPARISKYRFCPASFFAWKWCRTVASVNERAIALAVLTSQRIFYLIKSTSPRTSRNSCFGQKPPKSLQNKLYAYFISENTIRRSKNRGAAGIRQWTRIGVWNEEEDHFYDI